MNARRLTVEGQLFLDDIDALPAEGAAPGDQCRGISQKSHS